MVLIEPIEGTADQEGARLIASVVEDEAAPVLMETLARIGVLEQMGSIEETEAVLIGGEVRRDPVQKDADPVLMEQIDQVHQILRRSVAAGGREVSGGLITPRTVERMFGERQELDVGEAHLLYVLRQPRCNLSIAERAIAILGYTPPGPQMDLIDTHGGLQGVAASPGVHPVFVAPLVVKVPDHQSGARRRFVMECKRVGLVGPIAAMSRGDVILVDGAFSRTRYETLPDSRSVARAEGMGGVIPAVEITNHVHRSGVGSPDGEVGSLLSLRLVKTRAQFFVETKVVSFVEEVNVVVAQVRLCRFRQRAPELDAFR